MTPEVTQQVSRARSEFYAQFAQALGTAVTINKEKSYASTPPKASWLDQQQRLNYLCVYAHSAPDVLVPARPLVLRIGVNLGAELLVSPSRRPGQRQYNRACQFYLTLLPQEMLGLIPWILTALERDLTPGPTAMPQARYTLVYEGSLQAPRSVWTSTAQKAMRIPLSSSVAHP